MVIFFEELELHFKCRLQTPGHFHVVHVSLSSPIRKSWDYVYNTKYLIYKALFERKNNWENIRKLS